MRGTIQDLMYEAGMVRIHGDDGVTYHAHKLALDDLAFDRSLTGRVSFIADGRTARRVRRWPRTRQAFSNAAPSKTGVIKHVSARGDFAFVEVPMREHNVFVHRAHFQGGFDSSMIGATVTYDRIGKDESGRDQLMGVKLTQGTA